MGSKFLESVVIIILCISYVTSIKLKANSPDYFNYVLPRGNHILNVDTSYLKINTNLCRDVVNSLYSVTMVTDNDMEVLKYKEDVEYGLLFKILHSNITSTRNNCSIPLRAFFTDSNILLVKRARFSFDFDTPMKNIRSVVLDLDIKKAHNTTLEHKLYRYGSRRYDALNSFSICQLDSGIDLPHLNTIPPKDLTLEFFYFSGEKKEALPAHYVKTNSCTAVLYIDETYNAPINLRCMCYYTKMV